MWYIFGTQNMETNIPLVETISTVFAQSYCEKFPQEVQTEILQKICGWCCCTFWKTWTFTIICCIYKQHPNIWFSVEAGKNGAASLLGVKIWRENGKCVTSVCRKETFSRMYVCTNFIRLEYKFGLSYIFFVGVFAYFQIFQTKDSDEIWKT